MRYRDPIGLQEHDYLADGLLRPPRLFDGIGAMGADSRHLAQAGGLLGDDLQCILTKMIDDLIGVDFADSRNQPAAEVFADAVDRGGQGRRVGEDLELLAVERMVDPMASELEGFTTLDPAENSFYGDCFARFAPPKLTYAEVIFPR